MKTSSPVLFLVFNRPDTTRLVFDAIRHAQPARLYVAADGPRADRIGESERCAAVKEITMAVDWPCEVSTLFRDENLGCRRAVSSALTWFFEQESEGIVLEDDCLPNASFFPYCDELLARYRNDPRVMCISGNNFIAPLWQPEASYYFSKFTHIWGWASWRRAWAHYDVDMQAMRHESTATLLRQVFPREWLARTYWSQIFEKVARGEVDSWAYQWTFSCWKKVGVTCLPRVNLVSNIGFGADATHTHVAKKEVAHLLTEDIGLPLAHPKSIQVSEGADAWSARHVFGINHFNAFKRGLANVPLLGPGLQALRGLVRSF